MADPTVNVQIDVMNLDQVKALKESFDLLLHLANYIAEADCEDPLSDPEPGPGYEPAIPRFQCFSVTNNPADQLCNPCYSKRVLVDVDKLAKAVKQA